MCRHRKCLYTDDFYKAFFSFGLPHSLANPRSFSSQGLSPFPKATHWVFLSRKSLCWAWCPTPQRCSAPYRAVSPCWAPHPSTKSPWPKSRDACLLPSASTPRCSEASCAGQSSSGTLLKLPDVFVAFFKSSNTGVPSSVICSLKLSSPWERIF